MKPKWLLLVILCVTLFTAPLFSDIPQTERDALIAFYNSTDGANWKTKTNWRKPGDLTQFNDPGTEHTWYGVTCDAGLTTVEHITLPSNDLSGTLPAEINSLTQLKTINLERNQLTGSIPDMTNLTALQLLSLRHNSMSGTIPASLNNLTGLTSLQLDYNGLTGTIPDLGSLVSLTTLDLRGNQLTGTLPAWLNNLVQLYSLYLNENQLTGTIVSLTDLTGLVYLELGDNQLTGSIPTWINQLTQLKSLGLDGNQFTGTIPDLLGLTTLNYLVLGENQLSGSIPVWLNSMTTLTMLQLGGNQFTGTIPDLGNLTSLFNLRLNDNQLTGPLPSWLANMTNLQYLFMDGNSLSGTIDVVGSLSLIERLHLSDNSFSGTLPAGLGNLTALSDLALDNNRFSGPIPAAIGNMAALQECKLNGNALSGPIPTAITNCISLMGGGGLDINWNCLYTNDDTVRSFVTYRHQGDWESTQTIAPADVYANEEAAESVKISWTPIVFQSEGGAYRVLYSTTAGSGYLEAGVTADKTINTYTVTGLTPGTDYYFVVETETSAHGNNINTVVSEKSAEVTATTGSGSITVTSPNGGEEYFTGASVDITWTSAGSPDGVILYYSADSGVTWDYITGPIADSGTYTWTVPNLPFSEYLVKIEDETGTISDVSDAFFTVKWPVITVTAPNGGEEFFMGTQVTVSWTYEGQVDNVVLYSSGDGGSYWEQIAGPIPNTGTYDWILPNMPSPEYMVKVEEEHGFAGDASDAFFNVKAPEITVTSPLGAEEFFMGTPVTITWTSAGVVDNVILSFSFDGGQNWETIEGPIPNAGLYDWILPNIPSPEYMVKVEEEHGFISDTNDSFFNVKSPEITVTSPLDAEEFFMGTPITITWTSAGVVDNVILSFSYDGGQNWETIEGPIPNSGIYDWILP
ncbi:MAG: hypothetical protein GY765_31235, partial [bacterium]|nr:hypothetical protein [bacterium]